MKIYKYKLDYIGEQLIKIPLFSNILSAGIDSKGDICIWAAVWTDSKESKSHKVFIVGTGSTVPREYIDNTCIFLASVKEHSYIWHIFVEP